MTFDDLSVRSVVLCAVPASIVSPSAEQSQLDVVLGSNVEFVCVAEGNPPPCVQWSIHYELVRAAVPSPHRI